MRSSQWMITNKAAWERVQERVQVQERVRERVRRPSMLRYNVRFLFNAVLLLLLYLDFMVSTIPRGGHV